MPSVTGRFHRTQILGYRSRSDLVADLVGGKSVLHLGAVGQTEEPIADQIAAAPHGIHALITEKAAHCVGVDIDAAAVAALHEHGVYTNVIAADVLTLDRADVHLDTIDVVFAGDIIEHIANPGQFLQGIAQVADPGATLVLTTPNAFGLFNFVRYCLCRTYEGNEHVCSFNVATICQLLEWAGWQPQRTWTCYQDLAATKPGFRLGSALIGAFPAVGGTLLIEATR